MRNKQEKMIPTRDINYVLQPAAIAVM